MKTKLLILSCLLFAFGRINAQVSLPFYEGFDYPGDASLVSPAGNLGPWLSTFTTDAGGDPKVISEPIWTLPTGIPTPTGSAVEFTGGSDDPVIIFADQGTTGFIYSSFVFRVTDQSLVTDKNGGFIYSFGKVASNGTSYNYTSAVYLKNIDANSFYIGVSETNKTDVAVFSTTPSTIDTDYFIVIAYDITNATSKIWINPVANTVEPIESLNTSGDAATGRRDNIVCVRISLESNAKTPTTILDEIRIGNTWEAVTAQAPLSVAKNELESKIKLYPNPAKDYIAIESNSVKISSVEIFDLLGKRVKSQSQLSDSRIQISDLSKGLYILKINAEEGSVSKKVVIE